LRASADLFALEWKYPQVVRYGRSGQRQVVKTDEFYPLAQRYPGDHGNRRDISQPTKGGLGVLLKNFGAILRIETMSRIANAAVCQPEAASPLKIDFSASASSR
jgi:hypothetical protein